MHLNSSSRVSRRCISPALKGITHYFSSRKVLLIRSAGVIATYKIDLRTSLLPLQFCLSHYVTDTFEKAP